MDCHSFDKQQELKGTVYHTEEQMVISSCNLSCMPSQKFIQPFRRITHLRGVTRNCDEHCKFHHRRPPAERQHKFQRPRQQLLLLPSHVQIVIFSSWTPLGLIS